MKKARIILTAIAMLAIVGGALAYKAKFNGRFVYTILVGNTTVTETIDGKTYTAAVTQLCTTTNKWFTNNGVLTTVSTNGAALIGTAPGGFTAALNYYTTCVTIPNTFTTPVN